MTALNVMQKVSRLPGLRRRRVRVWLMVVGAITLLLAAQVIWPTFRVMPQFGDGVGPGAFLAVFLAALICEYVDSSLGMGYGTTLTPLLLLAGFSPLQIVPCVLCSEFITGALSGLFHHRDGNVNFLRDREARSTVVMLSMLSVVGAIVAVTLALSVPKVWLTGIIGVMVLSIGVVILATIRRQLRYRRGHLIALGAVAAFNKGLSGGGYGPLVTAGQVVSGVKAKHAVAITSIAESLTCLVGLVAYFVMTRGLIDIALLLPLVTGAVLSVPIATLTVRRIPDTWMRSIVGVMTCLLGLLALSKLVW